MKFNNFLIILLVSIGALAILFYKLNKKASHSGKAIPEKIIIGTNAEYPPYTFMENNEIVGFDIDVAKEVFKRAKKDIQIKDMAWTALIPAIQLGQIHSIAAGMTATPERAKHALFTKPYIEGDPLLIVNLSKDEPIHTIDDLKGKKVVVDEGYTADMYMTANSKSDIIRTSSPVQGFQALKSGRASAYVIAKSSAEEFFKKYGKEGFNIVEIPDATENYSLAVSKRYPQLFTEVQEILNTMIADGTIDTLKIKWKIK